MLGAMCSDDDASVAETQCASGVDIGEPPDGQRLRACHARHLGHDRQGDGADEVDVDAGHEVAAERRDKHQREHGDRDRQQDFHEALEHQVDPAAEIGRADADEELRRCSR